MNEEHPSITEMPVAIDEDCLVVLFMRKLLISMHDWNYVLVVMIPFRLASYYGFFSAYFLVCSMASFINVCLSWNLGNIIIVPKIVNIFFSKDDTVKYT